MTTIRKLLTSDLKMLKSLEAGPKLTIRWDGGNPTPGRLKALGLIRGCDHPRTKDRRSGYPAQAYELTELGRAALAKEGA
jgi:hypothetical protein